MIQDKLFVLVLKSNTKVNNRWKPLMSKTKINTMVKKVMKVKNKICTMVHHLKEKKWKEWMMKKSRKNMTKKKNKVLNNNK